LKDHFPRERGLGRRRESTEAIVALLLSRRLSCSDFPSEHMVVHSSFESGHRVLLTPERLSKTTSSEARVETLRASLVQNVDCSG
jgi:hypothetical protein